MLVDDDGINLKALSMYLSKINIQCELANNGKEAIKILEEKYAKEH